MSQQLSKCCNAEIIDCAHCSVGKCSKCGGHAYSNPTPPTSTTVDIETVGKVAFNELLHGKKRSIDLSDHEYACMKAYMTEYDIEWDKIENLNELQSPPTSTVEGILGGISFSPEFDDTHGGCPPRYRGGRMTGLTEATQAITRLIAQAEAKAELRGRKAQTQVFYDALYYFIHQPRVKYLSKRELEKLIKGEFETIQAQLNQLGGKE